MACPDLQQLEQFLDHGLSDQEEAEIRRHLHACPSCRDLLADVEANLQILEPLRDVPPPAVSEAAPSAIPESIGNFGIVREIGRGGMGIVYEAEQLNPKRRVALKVLNGGSANKHHVELFRREARALARLRHPNVASIFEAGLTANGQHYLVMELVEGVPLRTYIRQGSMPDRERLELIGRIARAINHAHQRGVIHRDIKPSNILVDANGHPRILDFGLARIMDPDTTHRTSVTDVGKLQGTLPYMSPEQLRGESSQVDLRGDVYSLGVILYETLTSRLPHDVQGKAPHEAMKHLVEATPPNPSSLRHGLGGDVETIMLKALEKDPEQRYQSALALAEDIDRFLAQQPILARPPSSMYQLRKLAARHKLSSALVVVLFLLLTGFSIWMSALYARTQLAERQAQIHLVAMIGARNQAEVEAESAREEAQKAWRVGELFQDVIAALDPTSPRPYDFKSQELLDEIGHRVGEELSGYPELEAEVRTTLGTAFTGFGLYGPAEKHLGVALALREEIFGRNHPEVAEVLQALASTLTSKGDFLSAARLYERSVMIYREAYGHDDVRVASALDLLAYACSSTGDAKKAIAVYREALAIQRLAPSSESPGLSERLLLLAVLLHANGNRAAAKQMIDEARQIGPTKLEPSFHWQLRLLEADEMLFFQDGQWAGVEELARQRLQIIHKHLGERHPRAVRLQADLVLLRLEQGDLDGAEQLARKAWATCQTIWAGTGPVSNVVRTRLGGVSWAKGDYESAERHLRAALDLASEQHDSDPQRMHGALNSLGVVLRDQGRFSEAESLLRQSLTVAQKVCGDDHAFVANSTNNLARLMYLRGNFTEAEALARAALAKRRKLLPPGHPEVTESMMVLGMILTEQSDPTSAEPLLRTVLENRRRVYAADHWLVGEANSALGACLTALGHYSSAEQLLQDSLSVFDRHLQTNHKLSRLTRCRLIALYEAWGQLEKIADFTGGPFCDRTAVVRPENPIRRDH